MANKKYKDPTKPFKWKQSTGDIILWLVTWYCRYALTYRDLTEMALERGYKLERSTINRWVHEYAPEINKRAKPYIKKVCDSWKCDETYRAPILWKLHEAITGVRARLECINSDIWNYHVDVYYWLCSNMSRNGSDLQNTCKVM